MDGIQLASELKRRTPAKSVVILITAAEWTTIKTEAKRAGVDKFRCRSFGQQIPGDFEFAFFAAFHQAVFPSFFTAASSFSNALAFATNALYSASDYKTVKVAL